ncbi:T9SS type A sorting domain-containing protein [bacterium]|nr:T9SS type A sorting domain-containing protein [bacterium]MBU1983535.1 T9SS type A sorting domain-containing protein [bacterium]
MKRVVILLIATLMAWPAFADINEGFETFTNTSYGTYDINGFHIVNGLGDATYPYVGSRDCRLRDSASPDALNQPYCEYIGVDGNGKDGGVGTFSFWYRSWDGSPASVYDVTYSIDGGAHQSAGQINTTSTTYAQFSYNINSTSDNIKIRVQRVSGERLHIDEFYIQDNAAPSGHETDAHVAAGGAGALATISSLVDTEAEAQVVMTFDVRDDGAGSSNENTVINGVSIVAGSANTLSNWTQVIAGAKLTDGVSTWTGTVAAGAITFTGAPLATLPDGGPWQTWSLSVWLTTTLPYYADNEILEFKIGPTNFETDTADAGFDPADVPVESGDFNNQIDIMATELGITTQPPATAAVSWTFTVRAGFADENGGIDEDFPPEDISLSVSSGIGNLSSASGLTKTSSNGQSAWTDLLYDVADDDVVLQAVSATYPGPALTNAFDVASITVDAYPLCWDGNATDQAVPFVVHISIRNWESAAGQNCYVKVYDGGNNPFHYTDGSGWSSSTAWAAKPIITLDANGDWSGWLALKSKGLTKFRPRVALVSSTSTYITGFEVLGTMVDLTTTGVVVEDRDGIRSYGTPGNIILVRGGGGAILGSWIIEDNGYPLDDGGSAIASGGWRLAMCDVCEDVTFESWAPAKWPNGYDIPSFFDIVYDFCPTPGSVVEMDDVQLPVELLSFTATAGDRAVRLNWTTASETDNVHFLIERNGETAARIESRGNSATGHEYSWTDEGLDNGATYRYTLLSVSLTGDRAELQTVEATPTESAAMITEYALYQNYPNPFNPATQIKFDLLESGLASLKVYNLMGQAVATLVNATLPAGAHVVSFDAANLPSGLYLYRIEVNGFTAEKKMLLMK